MFTMHRIIIFVMVVLALTACERSSTPQPSSELEKAKQMQKEVEETGERIERSAEEAREAAREAHKLYQQGVVLLGFFLEDEEVLPLEGVAPKWCGEGAEEYILLTVSDAVCTKTVREERVLRTKLDHMVYIADDSKILILDVSRNGKSQEPTLVVVPADFQ